MQSLQRAQKPRKQCHLTALLLMYGSNNERLVVQALIAVAGLA
jgi:hypothetical protein